MEKKKDETDISSILIELNYWFRGEQPPATVLTTNSEFLINEEGVEKVLLIEGFGKNRINTKEEYDHRSKIKGLASLLKGVTIEELEQAQSLNRSLEEFNID